MWFNGCEGKTTTELTVYGSMYVKEKQQSLQCMVQRMHRGEKSLLCMVQCMQSMASGFHTICSACRVQPAALALK